MFLKAAQHCGVLLVWSLLQKTPSLELFSERADTNVKANASYSASALSHMCAKMAAILFLKELPQLATSALVPSLKKVHSHTHTSNLTMPLCSGERQSNLCGLEDQRSFGSTLKLPKGGIPLHKECNIQGSN